MYRLNVDYIEMQKEVARKIVRGEFNEILEVLRSYLKKGYLCREAGCCSRLSLKKFNKFNLKFDRGLNIVLNQSIQQILYNADNRLEVDSAKQMSSEP